MQSFLNENINNRIYDTVRRIDNTIFVRHELMDAMLDSWHAKYIVNIKLKQKYVSNQKQ